MQTMMKVARYDPDPISVAGSGKNNMVGRTWVTWAYEESRRRYGIRPLSYYRAQAFLPNPHPLADSQNIACLPYDRPSRLL